jgi:adenosylhomocysteinase
VLPLADALAEADVIITATGARHVISSSLFPRLRDGTFLINVGHANLEIDIPALYAHPHETIIPFVEEVTVADRRIRVFADGSMANLSAGQGDSLNAFDVTLATMVAGIGFCATSGPSAPPGLHMLPREAWLPVARRAVS